MSRKNASPLHKIIPPGDRMRVARVLGDLRDAGLTYKAIAVVIAKYEGYELTPRQVHDWARRLGFEKRDPRPCDIAYWNGRQRVAA